MDVRNPTYSVTNGAVLVVDARNGNPLWHGEIDEVPAVRALGIPNSEDAIVLLDYMAKRGAFANLVRIGPDGAVRWRAQLPTSDPSDAYVNFELNGRLSANSWTGHRVVLDIATGEIKESDFVK